MSMHGKNHYNIVISLQLIKINEKNLKNLKKERIVWRFLKKLGTELSYNPAIINAWPIHQGNHN